MQQLIAMKQYNNVTMHHPSLAHNPLFDPMSKVWIYTASRELTEAEAAFAQQHLDVFTRQWTSHNVQMKAAGEVYARRYVILLADETHTSTGGCSIDKSVHFLEALGRELGVDFFDRMLFGWVDGSDVRVADRNTFSQNVKENIITDQTLTINTLATTKADLAEKWLLPFSQSWIQRLV